MGQRIESGAAVFVIGMVLACAVDRVDAGESCEVELLRLGAERPVVPTAGVAVHTYAIVVHVPAGRELHRADCVVRDGFVVERPYERAVRTKARRAAISRVAIDLLVRGIDEDLGLASGLVGELVLGRDPRAPSTARRRTKLALRANSFEHHATYAVSIVALETTALTRIDCERIVTRRARRGDRGAAGRERSRERAAPALAPAGDAPGLARDALDELLRGHYRFPDPLH